MRDQTPRVSAIGRARQRRNGAELAAALRLRTNPLCRFERFQGRRRRSRRTRRGDVHRPSPASTAYGLPPRRPRARGSPSDGARGRVVERVPLRALPPTAKAVELESRPGGASPGAARPFYDAGRTRRKLRGERRSQSLQARSAPAVGGESRVAQKAWSDTAGARRRRARRGDAGWRPAPQVPACLRASVVRRRRHDSLRRHGPDMILGPDSTPGAWLRSTPSPSRAASTTARRLGTARRRRPAAANRQTPARVLRLRDLRQGPVLRRSAVPEAHEAVVAR